MKKVLLSVITFLFFVSPVFAVVNEQNPNQNATPSQGEMKATNQNPDAQAKCDAVSKKVNLVTSRYDANKLKYMNAFENIARNMENVINRLQENGYDTAELERNMEQVRKMIQNTNQYYANFQKGLDNSKQFVCGNGSGDYAREMTQAREQLRLTRQEMLQLRQFIQETVVENINEIRDQIAQ